MVAIEKNMNLGCLLNALETSDYFGVERKFKSFIAAKTIYSACLLITGFRSISSLLIPIHPPRDLSDPLRRASGV